MLAMTVRNCSLLHSLSSKRQVVSSPAGWYLQPDGQQRYWDGEQWTEHIAPGFPLVRTEPLHGSTLNHGSMSDYSAVHTKLVPQQPNNVALVLTSTQPIGPRGMTRSPLAVWLFLPIRTLGIYTPLAVWLFLPIRTLGIYTPLVWHYKFNREFRDFHPSIQVDLGLAFLALFFPIACWITVSNTGERIAQAQQLSAMGSPCSGTLALWRVSSLVSMRSITRASSIVCGVRVDLAPSAVFTPRTSLCSWRCVPAA
jgi:Protein of unknown function (DUF2510)/Domain of unknown function (DUF4234)